MTQLAALWSDGPIVALDLETTDVDPHRDRIVTASVVTVAPQPGQSPAVHSYTWLTDPGVEIPADATAIHGITTEQAQRDGRPTAEVIAEITAYLAEVWTLTSPLCAFNAPFDLTMLDAELRRHHQRSLALSGPVIDPLCIDRHLDPRRTGRRTLRDVCVHYGVRLDQAHDGTEDALAAARLAWRLATSRPTQIGLVAPRELHGQQSRWFRAHQTDFADKLDWRARKLVNEGANATEVARLRDHATDTRAAAKTWPLLPERTVAAQPTRRRLPPRPGGPRLSHASWTREDEAALHDQWLSASTTTDAEALRVELAEHHGRSPGAIRSRLLKLRCDPEMPGHTCDERRAAELKQRYDAEYGR
ncbi:exonuclease domain-containing protein [Sciscionella marina]|uniref:exonuclease domain-containing protein n=1 Tax=Sciscionella marina TaxID=508770 RepID=UPI00036E06B6|nr:exonuclease domain-containing protein [Sciscionella marina]